MDSMDVVPPTPALPRSGPRNEGRERSVKLDKLVLEMGADSVRLGIIPNLVAKVKDRRLVGEEIYSAKDLSGVAFKRPFDRILDLEKTYTQFGAKYVPSEIDVLITEPVFNPEALTSLKRNLYEVVFEQEGFRSLATPTPPLCALTEFALTGPWRHDSARSHSRDLAPHLGALVIDSGYSFTHVVPFFDQTRLTYATKRIDIGGKFLTNYLKDIVSYRHYNMLEETWLMNHVKEQLCFVSQDFLRDMERIKRAPGSSYIKRHYVLPDYVHSALGWVREDHRDVKLPDDAQLLVMNTERIEVPELLFNPINVELREAGLAETVMQAMAEVPEDLHELMFANVLLVGGNAKFPGYRERFYSELRPLVPAEYELNVYVPEDPITYAWRGAAKWMLQPAAPFYSITKAEYDEHGGKKRGWELALRRSITY